MLQEFKKFALKGNVVDMAVGIIIGGAFTTIVRSLVGDVMMPPLGLLLGGVDFTDLFIVLRPHETGAAYATLSDAQAAGAVTLNYGVFTNNVIAFLIVALATFLLVRAMLRVSQRETPPPPANTKACDYCRTDIPVAATRCPHCTSQLTAA